MIYIILDSDRFAVGVSEVASELPCCGNAVKVDLSFLDAHTLLGQYWTGEEFVEKEREVSFIPEGDVAPSESEVVKP